MTPEFQKEANRLILMIDAANLQATTIKGTPDLKQRMKQIFNPFWVYGAKLSRQLKQISERENQPEEFEQEAWFVYEALREMCDSKNKIEALALLKLYNEGKVIVTDDNERSE